MGNRTRLGALWAKLALLWITPKALSIDALAVRKANRPHCPQRQTRSHQ